jgi:hypothetical protein
MIKNMKGADMPKKSETVRGNKSHEEHSPMKDRARKPGHGEASYDVEDRQKKGQEVKSSGRKNPFNDIGKPVGGMERSTDGDNGFNEIGNLSNGKTSKKGCFPKLFMFVLSMAAGAAYFFLHS